jgi:hypothetical protein
MISFPLYFFLFVYAFFFLVFIAFFFTNLLHLIYTGTADMTSFTVTLLILIMTVFTLYGTWYFLRGTDWQQAVVVWNSSHTSSLY